MTTLGPPVGWIDERGVLFPLCYYKPETANYLDAHKAGWRHVFAPAQAAPVSRADHALERDLNQVRPPVGRSS